MLLSFFIRNKFAIEKLAADFVASYAVDFCNIFSISCTAHKMNR